MLESVPPSVFFGKRTTRALTKVEPGRAAACQNTSTKPSKTQINEVTSLKGDSGERRLRSVIKNSSKKTSEPATSTAAPLSRTQRNPRACKNATKENPTKSTTKSPPATRPKKKPDSDDVQKPHQDKNLVYKPAIVESTFVKDSKVPVDEYEFQVESPEGTSKKRKRRQPRQKCKVQTLWGLTVRPETKEKRKPFKKVTIQEPENVKPANRVIQLTTISKEVQPSVKKTPPLQERAGNTLSPKVTSNSGGYFIENPRKDSVISLSSSKKNAEAKENNPPVEKKMPDAKGGKVQERPFKERTPFVHSNCMPARSVCSSPLVNSLPTESSKLSPPAINDMSVMLSPIHGCAKSATQSFIQSENREAIHASTPVVQRSQKEITDANISLHQGNTNFQRLTTPAPTSVLTDKFAQSVSSEPNCLSIPLQDSENQQSSNTVSDFDNSDNLFHPEILQDLQNGAKPSIPDRMLGGRKPTMFRGPTLNRFKRQGTEFIVPVSTTESCWRVVPTTKYIYDYESTLDDCFGFDNGPDAYAIDIYPLKQPVIQKKQYIQSERHVTPQHNQEPCSQLQKKLDSMSENPCLHSQTETCSTAEETHKAQPENPSSLVDTKIDELLSASLSRLRKRKNRANDSTIFDSITSNEDTEPSSSSQTSNNMEDSNTSSRPNQPFSLFQDMEDGIPKAAFSKPPRRSYAHLRPLKRVMEEYKDEDEDEENNKKTSKPIKTVYKRRKMVQSTLVDQWAKDLSSHFAEVDDTQLITE